MKEIKREDIGKAYEVCPFCDEEVEVNADLNVQVCPNCGKHIVICSMCSGGDCTNCCLEKRAIELNKWDDELKEIKRRTLSREQLDGIRHRVDYVLSYTIPDNQDRGVVVDCLIDPIVEDILDTADWSGYVEDEYNEGDIDIAIARVIKNKITGEDW